MPYRKIVFRAGEYYHLYNRGNNYQPIFFDHENYLHFLRLMHKYFLPEFVDVIAYCLMPNHYHLLIYLKTDDLAGIMQPFVLAYTKSINKRYARAGALFQGRYKGVLVDSDKYLLHLSRYIHLNPVLDGLVGTPQEWEFSSYPGYIDLRNGSLPKPGIVLSQFPTKEAYRLFVQDYSESDRQTIDHLTIE